MQMIDDLRDFNEPEGKRLIIMHTGSVNPSLRTLFGESTKNYRLDVISNKIIPDLDH